MINFFKQFTWRRTGRFFTSIWKRAWPFVDKALDIAKPVIITAYDGAVDGQQEKLIAAYKQYGPRYMGKLFDEMQEKICDIVQRVPIAPTKWRDKACAIIEDEGNRFQRQLIETASNQGVAGLNKLIDLMQSEVRERIKAL